MTRLAPPAPTLSALPLALMVVIGGPAAAQPVDAPPSRPGNPQVRLYPGAGGDVFWQRSADDRGVRGYEITKNGTSLGVRDVLGVYDPTLRPDTPYTFTVAAVDTAGQRSPVATVSIGGAAAGPTTPTNPMAPVTGPGTAPATGPIRTGTTELGGDFPVRLSVYDAQSYELAWQRVPGAASYRLEVGGRTVQSSGAVSRYVSGVDTSASYAYTLTALDRAGTALKRTRFTVRPRRGAQLVATGGGSAPTPVPANPTTGPVRTGQTSLAGDIAVRLAVYDARSHELFWARVPGAVRYRLSLRGATVQESDAVSRFVGGADPAGRFDYTLLALDRSGAVLRGTSFTVAPRGDPQLTTFVPGPVPVRPPSGPGPGPTTAVPAPANVSARVYSATAAELFWDRAPAAARVVRTEISRDGQLLGSTPGNSFYDASRGPDRSGYAYTLVAVSADGARSAPTAFPAAIGTPDVPNGSGAPERALERVAEAFRLGAGVGLDAMYAAADRVLSRPDAVPGFARAPANGPAPQGRAGTWTCPNGGTVRVSASATDGDRTSVSLDVADCGFGEVRVSGDFEGTSGPIPRDSPVRSQRWEVAGYRFRDTRPGGIVVETGGDTRVIAELPDGADPDYTWVANLYRVTTPTGSYARTGETITFGSATETFEPDAEPGLIASLQRPGPGEGEARTGTPFRRPTDGAPGYRTGRLSVFGRFTREAGREYDYVLQSENGDPATFQLDVTENGATANAATTSYTVPWSERFDFGTFDPASVDFGL